MSKYFEKLLPTILLFIFYSILQEPMLERMVNARKLLHFVKWEKITCKMIQYEH
jgi:hypothetical protein